MYNRPMASRARPAPARELTRRGVRRVFCLTVKRARLLEWNRATDDWEQLHPKAGIEDPRFAHPVPIEALLDAALADDSVVTALHTRRLPALVRLETRCARKVARKVARRVVSRPHAVCSEPCSTRAGSRSTTEGAAASTERPTS
jgi:hypothetical protein